MKICIIAINKKDYAPQRIFKEGKERGHRMYLTTWNDIGLVIEEKKISFFAGSMNLAQFDAIIPRNCKTVSGTGKYKRTIHRETLLRLLAEYAKKENKYFLNGKYFSSYQSLDKLSQQYFLSENKLSFIPSYYFAKQNTKLIPKFPLVAKIADGSLGKQVLKLKNSKELEHYLSARKKDGEFFLFQKFYQIDHDYRILVANGNTIGVLKRIAKKGEWRTNFSLGGLVQRAERGVHMEHLAVRIANKMGLDYAGIDILEKDGKQHIIEINSLAQFKGFEAAFNELNVARELIKVIEERVREIKKGR